MAKMEAPTDTKLRQKKKKKNIEVSDKRSDDSLRPVKEKKPGKAVNSKNSDTAPSPPPKILLKLVGDFLTTYGFLPSSRLYMSHLDSRKKLINEWNFELEEELPKGFPGLAKIFEEWLKSYQHGAPLDRSQTIGESSNGPKNSTTSLKSNKKSVVAKELRQDSSSESSDESGDENEASSGASSTKPRKAPIGKGVKLIPPSKPVVSTKSSTSSATLEQAQPQRIVKRSRSSSPISSSSSASSSSSSSSSAADSSSPPLPAQSVRSTPFSHKLSSSISSESLSSASSDFSALSPAPAQTTLSSALQRKRSVSSSSGTSSGSELTNPAKSVLVTSKRKRSASPAATSTSNTANPPKTPKLSNGNIHPSRISRVESTFSSSKAPKSRKSEGQGESTPPTNGAKLLNKRISTPFQRVPKDTLVDTKLASNAYIPHDYGERAHQDLSVTKGKGFTKEKNKKKRGSYRGGAIDIQGGKGVKFDD